MKQEIIECTYELVDELKSSTEYKRLLELKTVMEEDPLIIQLVEEFRKWNTTYEDVRKYGKYHPDLKRTQIAFSNAKKALYEHPVVAEYKRLEQNLQQLLDHISSAIATSISTKIKHPNEIGLMQKH